MPTKIRLTANGRKLVEMETRWDTYESVDIKTCLLTDVSCHEYGREEARHHEKWSIDWQDINTPIKDSEFDWIALGIKKGDVVQTTIKDGWKPNLLTPDGEWDGENFGRQDPR
jgi:hypothetical protein